MKTYLDNVHETCILANRVAFQNRDGRAWDNRKAKTRKMYLPRGKAFLRLERLETSAGWKQLKKSVDTLLTRLNEGSNGD